MILCYLFSILIVATAKAIIKPHTNALSGTRCLLTATLLVPPHTIAIPLPLCPGPGIFRCNHDGRCTIDTSQPVSSDPCSFRGAMYPAANVKLLNSPIQISRFKHLAHWHRLR